VPKLRVATVWFSGCSGCHMSFLDLDERLLEFAERAELVFSPIVDIKEFPENVDVVLIEGAVGNTEHLRMLLEIRKKAKILVAFGRLRRDRERAEPAQSPSPRGGPEDRVRQGGPAGA
jgi:NAD-reducing hydrogenase small subunit